MKTLLLVAAGLCVGANSAWADSQTVSLTENVLQSLYPNNEVENYFNFVSMSKDWNDATEKTNYQLTAGSNSITVNKISLSQVSVPSSMNMFYAQAIGTTGNGYFQWRWDTSKGKYGLVNFGNARTLAISVTKGQIIVMEGGYSSTTTGSCSATYVKNGDYNTFMANETGNIAFSASGANIRALAILNPSASAVNYTVKYVDENGNEIKNATSGTGDSGANITLTATEKASFLNNDATIKYIYKSDDSEGKTIASDGSTVVTVTFREAVTWNYTVKSNLNTVIAEGSAFEGNTMYVGYPRYMLQGTDLYEASVTNKEYRKTFTLDENNKVVTVDYNLNKTNVVFYSEGEDIATETTSGNIPVRASNAKAAKTTEDVNITTLDAGKYKFYVGAFTSSAKDFPSIKLGIGEEVFTVAMTGANLNEIKGEYTVGDGTQIKYLAEGSADNSALDYIFIERILITNPGMEEAGSGSGFQQNVAGWNNCATVTNYRQIAITAFSNESEAFTGTYAFENWRDAKDGGLSGQMSQTISNIPNGTYKLQLAAMVNTVNGQFIYGKSGGVTYKKILDGENGKTADYSVMVCVTDNTLEIGLDMNNSGVDWAAIDNARLTYMGEPVTATTTSVGKGWATLYTDKALDFSSLSESLTAYTATVNGTNVTLNAVQDVPANTGVVLKSATTDANTTYSIPVAKSSETPQGSLKGSVTEAKEATEQAPIYILKLNNNDEAQFMRATSGSLAAGKAYLEIGNPLAKALTVVFANDPTGISNVNAAETVQPVKRIVNGQLVIEKNGKRYNAAGAEF